MKKSYLLIISCLTLLGTAFAQEENQFNKNYDPVRLELEEWDPIRGPWLASSLEAMSKQEPIPDRTFPEDITPAQMVSALPEKTRSNIERTVIANNNGSAAEQAQWNEIRRVVVRPGAGCGRRSARTYGDPHMVTFDGARYSFQTVGEFVLTKSTAGGIEVQTRQKPQREDFSLNTAVAMNVGGDRVGIYASDFPDRNRSNPVWVNGSPVQVSPNKAYFLSNGGTIRSTGRNYVVSWPTGETVQASIRSTGGMRFMNVNVQITDCSEGMFDGLLGNANGFEGDDFRGLNDRPDLRVTAGNDPFWGASREMEQRRLAFLANDLADRYRVTQLSSLFDYPPGTSTMTFTDRSFPRVHRTLNEIPRDRRMAAQRRCQQQGVTGRDLNGCIFDNSHLNIEPIVPPVVSDPTEGMVFEPVREPKPNVNKPIEEAGKDSEIPNRRTLTPLPMEDANGRQPVRESTIDRQPREPKEVKEENVSTSPRSRYTTSPALEKEPEPVRTSPRRTTTTTRSTPTRTSSPERSTPTRTTSPTRTTPSRSTPTRSTPTRSTPTRSTPSRSTPTRSTPARTTPSRSTPTRSTPARSTPTRSTPSRSTPSRSTPARGRG